VRHGRLEALLHHFAHDVKRERGVTGDFPVRKRLHPRLGRAFIRLADADADRGHVIEEEIRPVVRRDRDQHIGLRRGDALPKPLESALEPLFLALWQRIPLPDEKRTMARGVGADQASHRAAFE
jgi:hypothetical protein